MQDRIFLSLLGIICLLAYMIIYSIKNKSFLHFVFTKKFWQVFILSVWIIPLCFVVCVMFALEGIKPSPKMFYFYLLMALLLSAFFTLFFSVFFVIPLRILKAYIKLIDTSSINAKLKCYQIISFILISMLYVLFIINPVSGLSIVFFALQMR